MPRRYSLLLLVTLAIGPAPALAQSGVNLSWNDCGTYGQSLETFACNTNAGSHRLVASFVSPLPLTQVVGVEVTVDMAFNQPAVPSWWMAQPGGCRTPAITANTNFVDGPSSCADPWTSQVFTSAQVQPGVPFPNRVRLLASAAVSQNTPFTVDDVTEYYAVEFVIGNQKTVGPEACAGCNEPACVLLTSITLVQSVGVGNYTLTNPLDSQASHLVGWQCEAGISHGGCFFNPLNCATPARNPTWGSIKGMYR